MPKWLRRAERDLDQVQAYIARDNPRAAVEMVLTIIDAVEQLDAFPGMGRPQDVSKGQKNSWLPALPILSRIVKREGGLKFFEFITLPGCGRKPSDQEHPWEKMLSLVK